MNRFFSEVNKLSLMWVALMYAMCVADLVARNWFWAGAMFLMGSISLWQALPPYVKRRLKGKP